MGQYDVPTNIDFVLQQTGVEKLTYIGHSQGTTQFWLSNILHDELGIKIETMIGYAPVMFIGNQSSSLVNLFMDLGIDVWLEDHLDSILWLQNGSSKLNTFIYNYAPYFLDIVPRTTWAFVSAIVGFDKVSHMDPQRMPMMARDDVGGTSTVNLKHWGLLASNGKFTDLQGADYDVSKLKANLASTNLLLFVGANDALSHPGDFAMLESLLPSASVERIGDYNHLDYMWAKDADIFVNDKVI